MESEIEERKGNFTHRGFMNSILDMQTLNAGVKLGIFDLLSTSPNISAEEIKSKLDLKCNVRNLIDVLDKLHINQHLNREGVLGDARYSNTERSEIELVSTSKGNQTAFLLLLNMNSSISGLLNNSLTNGLTGHTPFNANKDLDEKNCLRQ